MFKLWLRDALIAGVLLILLAGATAALGLPAAPWTMEAARISADPVLLARDAALLAFALAALLAILHVILSGLRLLGTDYPAAAHLLEALASRLVRRAGALAGVLLAVLPGTGAARSASPSRPSTGAVSTPRVAVLQASPVPVPVPLAPPRTTVPPRRRTGSRTGQRPVMRRVGLALRYTVQPDDTMNDVAARFGLPDWRPIMQATRGVPQPVGGPITDPDLIYPGQILHIPLPCPALTLSGRHVLYVVRQEDTLSAIAARFLGDWRLYRRVGALNHGIHQPDGEALEDDNLIQPGWVLLLPQEFVLTQPDGTTSTRRVIVPDRRPARRRTVRRRRPALSPGRHHHGTTPGSLHASAHPHHTPAGPTSGQPSHDARPRHHGGVQILHPSTHPRHGGHSRRGKRGTESHRGTHHPASHPAPGHQRPSGAGTGHGSAPAGHPVRRRPVVHRRPRPGHHGGRPGSWPTPRSLPGPVASRPVVHVPDLGRLLPVTFVLGFLALATAVAASRRRALRRGRGGIPARVGTLAPSIQRAFCAALTGVEGRLAQALRRTPVPGAGGARAAHVLALLEQAGREAGVSHSLAAATRLLIEGAASMDLVVETARLSTTTVASVVQRFNTALGVPVTASRSVERDGTPMVTLTVKSGTLVAPAQAPHPTPLLVPLGATAEGAAVHLNLGRTGGLLVAGNGQSLVATLLASIVYQTPPDALRLLVASDDDELRKALPQLDHLDAPPADARDPRAVARLIAQAHTLVLERYERCGAATTATPGGPVAPPTPCLLVLAGIEKLDDEALDRLDAVAHTGPVCGVHLIATTNDPAALAASGMLALFRTRLARRLAPADNRLVCPDADTATLDPHDVLLSGLGEQRRLRAFILAPPEVREVCATVAAATVPPLPTMEAPPGPPPAPAPPSPASELAGLPAERDESTGLPAERDESTGLPAERDESVAAGPADEGRDPAPCDVGLAPTVDDAADDDAPAADAAPEAIDAAPEAAGQGTGPPLRMELLGGVAVYVHGQPINILPRERNILAALAVMGPRPVRRGQLIETLFGDEEDGGNTLSHALSDLRAALRDGGLPRDQARDVVRRSSAGYGLCPDLVEVDLWRFDALLRDAEGLDEAEAGLVRADAFALYHGPLCAGERLDFVAEHGHRWMKQVPAALYLLADHYRERGNLEDAVRWARRLLADEPCDDHTHQLVMNLLADRGDADGLDRHIEAMRAQYATRKEKMDPYTLRLYEQLRRKLSGESETRAG